MEVCYEIDSDAWNISPLHVYPTHYSKPNEFKMKAILSKIKASNIGKLANKHYCIFPLQDQKDLNDEIAEVFPRVCFLQWDTVGPYRYLLVGFNREFQGCKERNWQILFLRNIIYP